MKRHITRLVALGASIPSILFSTAIFADSEMSENSSLNLRYGATDISGQVYDLHMLMISAHGCEESGPCVKTCLHACKMPTQEFFIEEMGQPHKKCNHPIILPRSW